MTNKNPYERQGKEELDIPDFVEEKTAGSDSIDMSIFKMSDDELYDDTSGDTKVYGDDDDDNDEYVPKRKKKGNSTVILLLVIVFLLLAALAGVGFYALKQHQAYVKANTAYLQMQANENNYKTQIADQATTIETLNKQIEEIKSNVKGEGNIIYEVVDGPISFRKSASREADTTTYNGNEYAVNGDKFKVIEVVKGTDDPDYSWAKVADGVYFCIGTSSEAWAKKAE